MVMIRAGKSETIKTLTLRVQFLHFGPTGPVCIASGKTSWYEVG